MGKNAIISVIMLSILSVLIVIIVSNASHNLSNRDNDGGGVTTPTISSDGPPTFDDKLKNLDAALNNLIDACSKDVYTYVKATCIDEIEDAWWIDCSEYYDKLNTCKNGKVENFLKENNRPT